MPRIHSGILILAVSVLAGPRAYAQAAPQAQQHLVDDVRPLAQAVRILQEQCRCVITYEDPAYDRSQVVDVTANVSRDAKIKSGVFSPNGLPFTFTHQPVAAARGPDDMIPSVTALLGAFHRSANTSQFRLVRGDGALHVVPAGAGGSILDVPISIADTEATAAELLGAIVAAVNKASGVNVWPGPGAYNHMRQSTVRLKADREPAYQVLTRLLRETGRKITWHLYYDYGVNAYGLNLEFVDPGGLCLKEASNGQCAEVDPGDAPNAVFRRGR